MKKIPTLFLRSGDRRSITREVNPVCQWVLDGEGVATRKWDGTCCKMEDGTLYARRSVKPGKAVPENFVHVETDCVTGIAFGWVPVGNGPEWKHHRNALAYYTEMFRAPYPPDGSYELIGPMINGNPERWTYHYLVNHNVQHASVDRNWDAMRDAINEFGWEGFVFHHPDGRMAKIKAKDFPK